MDVGEVMDAMQKLMDSLEAVGKLHPEDNETQRLVSQGAFAGAAGMKTLVMLLLYKEGDETNGNGNGGEQ